MITESILISTAFVLGCTLLKQGIVYFANTMERAYRDVRVENHTYVHYKDKDHR